eukprot:CAMPEP_0114337278 /NCGR_PEP_ID=MMETSP0101-20121206/6261_1 /TAXON_ID=38822 ORGANISM="Pteridomonas danica, Strain PT" /NCGR_SAMPLE_ID=MMETSP0101 /ASSEMBLY_ACC=CAM_ASM_000211 /LENGTH=641 /DNA_ID=CAMNT_0001469469 /DNA_START=3319 /DNA_END=5245 /DNA_ORIENTATION=-
MDFGMNDFGIGLFLVLCNISLSFIILFAGYTRFKEYKEKKEALRAKAEKLEWAVGFSSSKFKTTFASINETSVPASDVLVFHYTSFDIARMAMRSGLPATQKFNGIPFTLRHPHDMIKHGKGSEHEIFGKGSSLSGPRNLKIEIETVDFPNDVLLVLSVPRLLLRPLEHFEEESYLCCLPVSILKAMRPIHPPVNILDVKPWKDGILMFPPTYILRSYQLVEEKKEEEEFQGQVQGALSARLSRKFTVERLSVDSENVKGNFKQFWMFDDENDGTSSTLKHRASSKDVEGKVIHRDFVDDYLDVMKMIRKRAATRNLVPLYHYTVPGVVPLILKGGMRMSTQGQGDGGVYFSLRSPLSYHLGTKYYESNIIKDCFGVERVNEYLGKGKLDALIVYGCEADMLVQAPGGRDNAKMTPKSYFTSLALPQTDGSFFLRPDRILTVFMIKANDDIKFKDEIRTHDIEAEMLLEKQAREDLSRNAVSADEFTRDLIENVSMNYSKEEKGDNYHHSKQINDDVEEGMVTSEIDVMRLSDVYSNKTTTTTSIASSNQQNNQPFSLGDPSIATVDTIEEAVERPRRLSDNPLFRPTRTATLDGNPMMMKSGPNKRYSKSTMVTPKLPLGSVNTIEFEMTSEDMGQISEI